MSTQAYIRSLTVSVKSQTPSKFGPLLDEVLQPKRFIDDAYVMRLQNKVKKFMRLEHLTNSGGIDLPFLRARINDALQEDEYLSEMSEFDHKTDGLDLHSGVAR